LRDTGGDGGIGSVWGTVAGLGKLWGNGGNVGFRFPRAPGTTRNKKNCFLHVLRDKSRPDMGNNPLCALTGGKGRGGGGNA